MNKFSTFRIIKFLQNDENRTLYWAYLVLVVLIITVVNAIVGLTKKKKFSNKDLRLGLFTLIFSHSIANWIRLVFFEPLLQST